MFRNRVGRPRSLTSATRDTPIPPSAGRQRRGRPGQATEEQVGRHVRLFPHRLLDDRAAVVGAEFGLRDHELLAAPLAPAPAPVAPPVHPLLGHPRLPPRKAVSTMAP